MKDKRKEKILELLAEHGYTSVTDLAGIFDVTPETIRRDLHKMEQENLVQKIHGGAIATSTHSQEVKYENRKISDIQEKSVIARRAAEEVSDGETIIITSGTTTLAMAEYLNQKKDLTIITNSILLVAELAKSPNNIIYSLGGKVRNGNFSLSGVQAIENLKMFNAHKLFIGIGGISIDRGLTDHNFDESVLMRACIEAADIRIGVADHTKFGTVTNFTISPVTKLNRIITTTKTPESVCQQYDKYGIDIVRAEMNRED